VVVVTVLDVVLHIHIGTAEQKVSALKFVAANGTAVSLNFTYAVHGVQNHNVMY